MKKIIITLFSVLFLTSAYADMSKSDKDKAWECSGIYMANYFLPPGETFEYSICLLYTSPSPRDATLSRMPSSA